MKIDLLAISLHFYKDIELRKNLISRKSLSFLFKFFFFVNTATNDSASRYIKTFCKQFDCANFYGRLKNNSTRKCIIAMTSFSIKGSVCFSCKIIIVLNICSDSLIFISLYSLRHYFKTYQLDTRTCIVAMISISIAEAQICFTFEMAYVINVKN